MTEDAACAAGTPDEPNEPDTRWLTELEDDLRSRAHLAQQPPAPRRGIVARLLGRDKR